MASIWDDFRPEENSLFKVNEIVSAGMINGFPLLSGVVPSDHLKFRNFEYPADYLYSLSMSLPVLDLLMGVLQQFLIDYDVNDIDAEQLRYILTTCQVLKDLRLGK